MSDEMSDQEFGHQVLVGAIAGIVGSFVVMSLGILLFVGEASAIWSMAWAAIVGGGFFGGTVTVGLAMGRAEKREKAKRAERARAARSSDQSKAA